MRLCVQADRLKGASDPGWAKARIARRIPRGQSLSSPASGDANADGLLTGRHQLDTLQCTHRSGRIR
jgi:hypothetical protein